MSKDESRYIIIFASLYSSVKPVTQMSLYHRSDTLLNPDAETMLLVEVVVWVLSRLHQRDHELLHGCADDLIGDLVVVAVELLEGCLSVAADLALILVLLDTEGCR